MAHVTRTLVLTGARAGLSCVLRKVQFVDGQFTVSGSESEVESWCKYMGRSYKAFPEGSAELAHYQKKDKEAGRGSNIDASPGGTVEAVSGAGAPGSPVPATAPADVGGGAAAAQADTADGGSGGDGHEHARVAGAGQPTLQQVIFALDPKDDEMWTAQGQPRIDAVAKASGREDLNRRLVEEAAPDFIRPTQ